MHAHVFKTLKESGIQSSLFMAMFFDDWCAVKLQEFRKLCNMLRYAEPNMCRIRSCSTQSLDPSSTQDHKQDVSSRCSISSLETWPSLP